MIAVADRQARAVISKLTGRTTLRIIISPAKQMRTDTDLCDCKELPVCVEQAEILKDWICSLT